MKIVCRCFGKLTWVGKPGGAPGMQFCKGNNDAAFTSSLCVRYTVQTFQIYSIHFTEHISISILVLGSLLDCCVHIFSLFFQSNETRTPNSCCPKNKTQK